MSQGDWEGGGRGKNREGLGDSVGENESKKEKFEATLSVLIYLLWVPLSDAYCKNTTIIVLPPNPQSNQSLPHLKI